MEVDLKHKDEHLQKEDKDKVVGVDGAVYYEKVWNVDEGRQSLLTKNSKKAFSKVASFEDGIPTGILSYRVRPFEKKFNYEAAFVQ